MTKEEREVMEMALDALEDWNFTMRPRPDEDIITAMKKCLANDALEKKAENARELGLDYEPVAHDNCRAERICRSWCGNFACVSHYADTTQPQQVKNEFKPDWDEKLALTEEVIRLSKRIEELEAQPEQEPWPEQPVGHIAGGVQPSKQEPVAWMHKHIEGNVIAHRPADINHYPERWTALYPEPKPCPTCEALARAVMMDQTGSA